jgi:hypothetical protein
MGMASFRSEPLGGLAAFYVIPKIVMAAMFGLGAHSSL